MGSVYIAAAVPSNMAATAHWYAACVSWTLSQNTYRLRSVQRFEVAEQLTSALSLPPPQHALETSSSPSSGGLEIMSEMML